MGAALQEEWHWTKGKKKVFVQPEVCDVSTQCKAAEVPHVLQYQPLLLSLRKVQVLQKTKPELKENSEYNVSTLKKNNNKKESFYIHYWGALFLR